MKKIKLFLLLFFISSFSIAQHSAYKPTGEKYRQLKDAKLLAVFTGDATFDSVYAKYVREVFAKKNVNFITYNEFEMQRTNLDYAFILPIELTVTYVNSAPKGIVIAGTPMGDRVDKSFLIGYLLGTKKTILKRNYSMSDFIAIGNFDASLPEDYLVNTQYRLKNIIQELQQTIEILEKVGEKKAFSFPSKYLMEVYNSKTSRVKEMELIVCDDAVAVEAKDFKKLYPYKHRVLNREDYKKEISQHKEGQCYLLTMGGALEVYIIDSYTGEIILETGFVPSMKAMLNPKSLLQISEKQMAEVTKTIKSSK